MRSSRRSTDSNKADGATRRDVRFIAFSPGAPLRTEPLQGKAMRGNPRAGRCATSRLVGVAGRRDEFPRGTGQAFRSSCSSVPLGNRRAGECSETEGRVLKSSSDLSDRVPVHQPAAGALPKAHAHYIWYVFVAIALVSAIGLIVFGRVTRHLDARKEAIA